MNYRLFTATSCAALLISAAPVLAVTITFDSFETNQVVSDVPGPGSTNMSTVTSGGGDIFGGSRTMEVGNTGGSQPVDATEMKAENGLLSFNNTATATGWGKLTYDGNGAGLGNLAFNTTNYFTFFVDYFDNDGAFDFTFTGLDNGGNTATYTETLIAGFNPTLSFSEILTSGASDPNFDFSDVYSISFMVDSTNHDESLDGIISGITLSAVPLPASALLLLAGLGGLGVMKRRRKA